MKIQQIRNATLVIEYAEKSLIDPFLADKGTYPPFRDSAREALPKNIKLFTQNK